MVKDREAWNAAIHRIKKKSDTTEQLKNNNKWPTSASSQVHRLPHSNGHFPTSEFTTEMNTCDSWQSPCVLTHGIRATIVRNA